jgi:nucleoside-diphosphate-sugar epimerase
MPKALVTGGGGFIGGHLAEALIASGWAVTVIDNLVTGHLENLKSIQEKIQFVEGDIEDGELLSTSAQECDVIFHQAAVVSVPQTVEDPVGSARVNDIGTLNVLEAARRNSVRRVVLASSCAVYGDDPQLPKVETLLPKPQSPYAVQKLTGEYNARLYHELYNVETVCLRYFNVYGPRQDPSSPYSGVISIFMTKAAEEVAPAIYGDGKQFRDFIYVKDVVQANLLAATAENASGKVFNIGTGKTVSINDLWEMVRNLSGNKMSPTYQLARAGDIKESVANIDQAKKRLGFTPEFAFENGLAKTFAWYRDQP